MSRPRLSALLLGLAGICLAGPGIEVEAFASLRAASGEIKSPPKTYRWIRQNFIDLDEVLREQLGIGFETCKHVSQVSSRISTYRGIGPCLYQLLIEGLQTPNLTGYVEAVANDLTSSGAPGPHRSRVHVFWQLRSGSSLFSNIWRLVKDVVAPAQAKSEQDALWGTIIFHFPDGDSRNLISNPALKKTLGAIGRPLKVFSISLFPVADANDPGLYQGMIFFFSRGAQASEPMYQIYFKTGPVSGEKGNYFLEVDGE
jgi:hypothetical protein